jgi:hypothetical protein
MSTGPGYAGVPPGSLAIEAVSRWMAASRGNPARVAASRQGSRPNLASAESTLSGILWLSSATDAYRKSLNAELRLAVDAARVTSIIAFCCIGENTVMLLSGRSSVRVLNRTRYAMAVRGVRVGNYLRAGASPRSLFQAFERLTHEGHSHRHAGEAGIHDLPLCGKEVVDTGRNLSPAEALGDSRISEYADESRG